MSLEGLATDEIRERTSHGQLAVAVDGLGPRLRVAAAADFLRICRSNFTHAHESLTSWTELT